MHHGHRRRLTESFLAGGVLSEIQMLELLLFYCISRVDTNNTSHYLLERFGSIEEVLNADINNIAEVPGMGSASAVKLKHIADIIHEYRRLSEKRSQAESWSYTDICNYISEKNTADFCADDRRYPYTLYRFIEDYKARSVQISDEPTLELIRSYTQYGNGRYVLSVYLERSFRQNHPDSLILSYFGRKALRDSGIEAIAYALPCGRVRLYKL